MCGIVSFSVDETSHRAAADRAVSNTRWRPECARKHVATLASLRLRARFSQVALPAVLQVLAQNSERSSSRSGNDAAHMTAAFKTFSPPGLISCMAVNGGTKQSFSRANQTCERRYEGQCANVAADRQQRALIFSEEGLMKRSYITISCTINLRASRDQAAFKRRGKMRKPHS
jgi:hypothetical protein